MEKFYSVEKNVQMLVALMKAHGVRKIVASPGATNVCLVGSLQHDPYFEIYSSVDERSAAYIACGLAAETGEAVALSCTGATASRNYVPGMTEAYYRHLPVLAITATQHTGRIGNYHPQVLDRSVQMNDIVNLSVQAYIPQNSEDEWDVNTKLNNALLALKRNGGGPVHINLATNYSKDFSIRELPKTRVIRRYTYNEELPDIKKGKVGIVVGTHTKWSDELTNSVEDFCKAYNAVVFTEHVSNYKGKYSVQTSLLGNQVQYMTNLLDVDTLIHIGYIAGAYPAVKPKAVWRVNEDGEIRDLYRKQEAVFEMKEEDFFKAYVAKANGKQGNDSYIKELSKEIDKLSAKIPELPFSNAWIAEKTADKIPQDSVLHLGILNTLRTWEFFKIDPSVRIYSNTGGFGIDGLMSSTIGASLANPNKLYFEVIGDLAFFYDLNSLGNRHVGNNLRIMLVNNGRGTEFRNFNHPAQRFGDDADAFMAAYGHFGKQSRDLVKHYAEDLGFKYLSANNKEEYLANVEEYLNPELTDKPILFEVFTDSKDESKALEVLYNLETSAKGQAKQALKNALGEKGVASLKKIMGK